MQAQATHELRRFPIWMLRLLLVLIAATLAALVVAGSSVYWHRTAAQPASITAVGLGGLTDANVREDRAARFGNGPSDADVLGQVDVGSAGEQEPLYLIVDGFTPY